MSLEHLNQHLAAEGIEQIRDVDMCPERTAYLEHLVEGSWDSEEWVKQLKSLKTAYKSAFYNYFAQVYPHIIFEAVEDKVYWNYDEQEGVYTELSFPEVRSLVVKLFIDEGLDEYATEATAKAMLVKYRGVYSERGVSYDGFDKDDKWFHTNNGWVNLETLEFESHTPHRLSRIKSAVDYDDNATCPRYNQFLDEDLQLKSDQVRVIDQFSGLSLTNDIRYQKMLTLTGRAGCGKSTLMDAWGYVLGDLMMEKKLTELQNDSMRFAGAQFVGSRLCWFDEVDVKRAEMGNNLGTLITGQHINIERKGVNGIIKGQNTLKCVLTANRLPLSAEIGIFRRLILIPITVSFSESETDDKDMGVKLKSEASGILNRMIRGLHDLRKMGGFTLIEGHEDLIEEYKASADIIAEFLDEYFDVGKEADTIPSRVMYNTYLQYTEMNSFAKSISPQKFGQLVASQPLTRFAHIRSRRDMRQRYWTGLKLKDQYKVNENLEVIVEKISAGNDSIIGA